jgi:hypothetical protein
MLGGRFFFFALTTNAGSVHARRIMTRSDMAARTFFSQFYEGATF